MSDHSGASDNRLSAYLYKWNLFSHTFKECGLVLRQFTAGGNVIKDRANQINCNLFFSVPPNYLQNKILIRSATFKTMFKQVWNPFWFNPTCNQRKLSFSKNI